MNKNEHDVEIEKEKEKTKQHKIHSIFWLVFWFILISGCTIESVWGQ